MNDVKKRLGKGKSTWKGLRGKKYYQMSHLLLTFILLIVSVSMSGNFSEALIINEEAVAFFGGANGFQVIDGNIHLIYQTSGNNNNAEIIYAKSIRTPPDISFERISVTDYQIHPYTDFIDYIHPVMAYSPDGLLSIIYSQYEPVTNQSGIASLYRLLINQTGNIISQDKLYDNVYATGQIIANNEKVNLLFKEDRVINSISRYHNFTDIFSTIDDVPGNIRFFPTDILYGKVHSNSDISITGIDNEWPAFYGLVTTGGHIMSNGIYPPDEVFLGGLIEYYEYLDFPGNENVRRSGRYILGNQPRDDAIAYITVDGNTYTGMIGEIVVEDTEDPDFEWIEGHNQFTVYEPYTPGVFLDPIGVNRIPKVDTIWTDITPGSLVDGSIFVPMELWISGSFSGKQTWSSSHDIYLKGDLTYQATIPGSRPDGLDDEGNMTHNVNTSDFLGIISEKSIYIQYGHKHPIELTRYRPNTDNIILYGVYCALGTGENYWEDGIFTYQYQFPKGSTPAQYRLGEFFSNLDMHYFFYPTTPLSHWPPGLDYPWYNPLWPEPGEIYDIGNYTTTPNPHNAPTIVKQRGTVHLFGSIIQKRVGYLSRSGLPDFDTGIWDVENIINPNSPPQYGSPAPDIGRTGYSKNYRYDERLKFDSPPHLPIINPGDEEKLHFHYWTSQDGAEFNPLLSKEIDDFYETLKMAVHGNSTAIMSDRNLYLFSDENDDYETYSPGIPENENILEILFTADHIFFLTVSNNDDISKLYRFSVENSSLRTIKQLNIVSLVQTIYHHNEHILWAFLADTEVIDIHKFDFDGNRTGVYSWEHNITLPDNFSDEHSKLVLDSDTQNLYIAVHFVDESQSGNIYLSYNNVDFVGIETENETIVDSHFTLSHFPNPLSRNDLLGGKGINISFSIPVKDDVNVDVYNIRGQHIKAITSDNYSPGTHTLYWDGRDNKNNTVSSGIYFYRLKSGNRQQSSKLLIVK